MTATKTLAELETEAFAILTGAEPGATVAAEDLAVIDTYVDPLLDQLAADRVVYIGNKNEIPNEFFMPIVRLLANVCGPRFGSPMNEQAKQADEATLRRLNATRPTGEVMRAVYY